MVHTRWEIAQGGRPRAGFRPLHPPHPGAANPRRSNQPCRASPRTASVYSDLLSVPLACTPATTIPIEATIEITKPTLRQANPQATQRWAFAFSRSPRQRRSSRELWGRRARSLRSARYRHSSHMTPTRWCRARAARSQSSPRHSRACHPPGGGESPVRSGASASTTAVRHNLNQDRQPPARARAFTRHSLPSTPRRHRRIGMNALPHKAFDPFELRCDQLRD